MSEPSAVTTAIRLTIDGREVEVAVHQGIDGRGLEAVVRHHDGELDVSAGFLNACRICRLNDGYVGQHIRVGDGLVISVGVGCAIIIGSDRGGHVVVVHQVVS